MPAQISTQYSRGGRQQSKEYSEYDRSGNIGGIGIAIPGPFDYGNGISLIKDLEKYESLYGTNIKETLERNCVYRMISP